MLRIVVSQLLYQLRKYFSHRYVYLCLTIKPMQHDAAICCQHHLFHHPSHHTPQPTKQQQKTRTTLVRPPWNRNTMTPAALWPLVSWLDVDVVIDSSGNGRLEATTAHLSSDFHCRAEMTVPFSVSWKGEELIKENRWEDNVIGAAYRKTYD